MNPEQDQAESNPLHHCQKCDRNDSADNMVSCDDCECWEHYQCAGVNDSISNPNRSWKCCKCRDRDGDDTTSVDDTKISVSSASSSRRSQKAKLSLELLEKQRKLRLKLMADESKYLKEKYELLLQLEDDDDASKRSRVSSKTKRERLDKWLEKAKVDVAETSKTEPSNQQSATGDQVGLQLEQHLGEHSKGKLFTNLESQAASKDFQHFPSGAKPKQTSTPQLKTVQDVFPKLLMTKIDSSEGQTKVSAQQGASSVSGQSTVLANVPVSTIFSSSSQVVSTVSVHPLVTAPSVNAPNWSVLSTDPLIVSDLTRAIPIVTVPSSVCMNFPRLSQATPSGTVTLSLPSLPQVLPTVCVHSKSPELVSTTSVESFFASNEEVAASSAALRSNTALTFTSSTLAQSLAMFPEYRMIQGVPAMTIPHTFIQGSHTPSATNGAGNTSPFSPLMSQQHSTAGPRSFLPQTSVSNPSTQARPRDSLYQQPSSMEQQYNYGSRYGSGHEMCYVPLQGPTAPQLAARQVLPRELPTFQGDAEEWPIFYSSFKNTTEVCGYSDAENLARLQRSLRGHALESVRSRLLLPASVPHVIETLRRLYGRPEILINALLRKVRNVPHPKADNLQTIVTYGLAVQNLVDHIIISEQQAHLSNPMLLQELIEKLPTSWKLQWGCYKQSRLDVNLETFREFMSGLVNLASDLTFHVEGYHGNMKTSRSEECKQKERLFIHSNESCEPTKEKMTSYESDEYPRKSCSYCESTSHQISDCSTFKALDIDGRWKAVRQRNLCRTCLVPHRKWPCRSKKECGINDCRIRHHKMLHSSQVGLPSTTVVHHNHHFIKSSCLFRYVPVTIYANGKQINVFAFLDEGSSSTLLEDGVAEHLGVDGPLESLWLSWTGNITREEKNSRRVNVLISGTGLNKKYALENVQTVQKLELPNQTFCYEAQSEKFPHLRGLPIASYSRVMPRMIIGLEHVRLLTSLKSREGNDKEPVAVKTRLGWCAYGRYSEGSSDVECVNLHYAESESCSNQTLHEIMKQFFLVEESVVTNTLNAEVDKRAYEILEKTTIRKGDRFETGLLWKTDDPVFPNSFPMAVHRLKCLEKRLARDPELEAKVKEQIEGYELKQYAHKASKKELEQVDLRRVWYLPLGVVTNPKKPGKVRLIWDAAAKVSGVCFNDMLLKGPDLLTSLPAVLLRFRQRNIAVCGDIREMFHQIRICDTDKHSQRFLWRSSPEEPVQVYVMDVATFGATCSPCSAQYVKNKNALEHKESHPRAARAVTNNHYVDDFLDSVNTVDEAVELVKDVKHIHKAAGFEIRRFLSNSPEVLSHLGELGNTTIKSLSLDKQTGLERVLGMTWETSNDVFTFDSNSMPVIQALVNSRAVPSKRQVLRTVMSMFDPLGLIAHFIVQGKVLMQEIWRSGTDWDEPIANHLHDRWCRWSEMIEHLNEVKVPRCFFKGANLQKGQLHVFVDASETAYSCVAYLTLDCDGNRKSALVAAKTKVAPLKPLSIPRLELQAAMIGARLAQHIGVALDIPMEKRFFWSDSATVLAWLRSENRRYHQFVMFRVGEILSLTSVDEWRYVPSKLNVSDEATKWGSGQSFDPKNRWFQGPAFLLEPEDRWPSQTTSVPATSEELRSVFFHRYHVVEPLVDVARFSNFNRMLRAVAYVHRAVDFFRKRILNMDSYEILQSEELKIAQVTLWRQVQAQVYTVEVAGLSSSDNHVIAKSSALYQLSPFMDEDGVVRLGSRIGAAHDIPYSAKYPVILPKDHPVTFLLTDSFHRKYSHANEETVYNEMRQEYYVPSLRTLIGKVARRCQLCKIRKAKPKPPMMAPLPKVRLTPFIRPFTYVGVDYFGPLEVKVGRSVAKRWVALFTCLTVRAVHLEVVHSLSTKSCVMAFRRFVARRGAPLEVYSDNGTNFVGASRQLTEEIRKIRDINKHCAATFTNAHTTWFFNVPAAPHMGGPWERMVRSVKTAMIVTSESSRHPSDEVLETILLDAEAVVNTRPLTYVPIGTANDEALTPNHFLLYGSSGIKQPVTVPVDSASALRDSWKLAQHMVDGFWRRWVREYLPMLTRRTKWFEAVKPMEPGDVVIVIDGNARNRWERGRVLETIGGKDGQVRRAKILTARGAIWRPAVKIAVLDVGVDPEMTVAVGAKDVPAAHGSGIVAVPAGHESVVATHAGQK